MQDYSNKDNFRLTGMKVSVGISPHSGRDQEEAERPPLECWSPCPPDLCLPVSLQQKCPHGCWADLRRKTVRIYDLEESSDAPPSPPFLPTHSPARGRRDPRGQQQEEQQVLGWGEAFKHNKYQSGIRLYILSRV